MRSPVLLRLMALVTMVAGCGSQAEQPAARSIPKRDLTLVRQAPPIETASAVEMAQPKVQQRAIPVRQRARPAPVRAAPVLEPKIEPVTLPLRVVAPAAIDSVAEPAAAEPANARELPPGKTVTVIPASSGPSVETDDFDDFPPLRGGTLIRGEGTCRGRGRGRGPGGIGGTPLPAFR
jgi:hypothetical protein